MTPLKVVTTVVGMTMVLGQPRPQVGWPQGWPPPREGEEIWVPTQDLMLYVRSVTWYPHGDEDTGHTDPHVYVVLGPRRPD